MYCKSRLSKDNDFPLSRNPYGWFEVRATFQPGLPSSSDNGYQATVAVLASNTRGTLVVNKMALVLRSLLLLLTSSCLVYNRFYFSSLSTNFLTIPPSSPNYIISRLFCRHFRFVKSSHLRFFTRSYLSHNKSLLLLLLLLCGDVEVNSGPPDDIVKCVCSSTEESGLMLQCELCSCWLHNKCVNVPAQQSSYFSKPIPSQYF